MQNQWRLPYTNAWWRGDSNPQSPYRTPGFSMMCGFMRCILKTIMRHNPSLHCIKELNSLINGVYNTHTQILKIFFENFFHFFFFFFRNFFENFSKFFWDFFFIFWIFLIILLIFMIINEIRSKSHSHTRKQIQKQMIIYMKKSLTLINN